MADYIGFWRMFQASEVWRGLCGMALVDPQLESRVVWLWLLMRDAMDGYPNPTSIQSAISRVMEIVEKQMTPEAAQALAGMLVHFGLAQAYEIPGVEPTE